jgi:hypothetical protein
MKKALNKKAAKSVPKEEEKLIHTWGKFIERPRRTETLVCHCGNRYIKTRPRQSECIPCMVRNAHAKHGRR